MRVPVRWLKEFIDTGLSPQDLAHRLTMAGLEAEKIEETATWDKVYVGLVRKVERHPNADRLVLAEVNAGQHQLTVVTGAPNIAAGQKIALAIAGARLIDGHAETLKYTALKAGMIRGVRSEGMVCSEKELGLSEEHEGIMVLEPEAPIGMPLKEWLGDTVIEFEITPNLVHAFSLLGIAREASALTGKPVTPPPTVDLTVLPGGDGALVRIDAPDLCRRYVGVVIEGVTVAPSPSWLTRRLTAAGVRPINNIVDVTNYAMLELGQPLHAFDRDRLTEGRIVVRRAESGETLETLDHERRTLTPDMLIIADAARPVAIAGVMGGLDSEVTEQTTAILLESATFDMKSVRHTARDLRMRTDASARFERGLDPNLSGPAAARATKLLLDLCPGSQMTTYHDVYPAPPQPTSVSLPFDRIERVLGIRIEPDVVLDVLARLELTPSLDGDLLTVQVPSWRPDVTLPEDVIEEVARIVGYDRLPATLPAGRTLPVRRDPGYRLRRAVRDTLVAAGSNEATTYVTVTAAMLARLSGSDGEGGFLHRLPIDGLVRLRNPIQADRGLLRPTLIPSLLEISAENLKHETAVRFFETASIFEPRGRDELPTERATLGVVMAGQRAPLSRFDGAGELDFFDLKGTVEILLRRLGLASATFAAAEHPGLHPGRAASLTAGNRTIGILGELRPDVAAGFGIEDRRVGVAELDLDAVRAAMPSETSQVGVPHYLPVEQDFAVVVPETVPAADVQAALMSGAGPLATDVALFDIYRGPQIGEGNKSLAYRVTFTAPDRALTDDELVKVRKRIERTLSQRVEGRLRV